MNGQSTNSGHIDFAVWLFRLLTWDGVLPIGVILVPFLMDAILPIDRGLTGLVYVGLIIAAFFVRMAVGCRYIDGNNCSPIFQRAQVWFLLAGAFVLMGIDTLLVVFLEQRGGGMFVGRQDGIFIAALVSIYLACMVIAMYPGRAKPLPEVLSLKS
jgi:hypothetical protein